MIKILLAGWQNAFALRVLQAAALILFFQGQAIAATSAEKLQKVLAGVEAFSGDFTQKVQAADGKLVQEGVGHLDLAKPGKINWQLTKPSLNLMISDSKTLWLYDPDLEQVTLYDPQKLITDSPFALLMSDDANLWKQYTITESDRYFIVTPNNSESQVTKISLSFDGNKLSSLIIWDASEQKSEYSFSNIKINPSFNGKHFSFEIPADTDIDDQRN